MVVKADSSLVVLVVEGTWDVPSCSSAAFDSSLVVEIVEVVGEGVAAGAGRKVVRPSSSS